ncbi:16S rRNA (cytosine(967)-C(5))-methyltransferase RsmB [Fastidiosibacter lacustris]|uniref:16S rRNA (cytosine(967)-C(5))-methyltransferase RsmB n=1 Tax=Fastidiosibacter lacustris TaxID=2056695 RepID=UPI000E352624|nr:16S rRNA (cytosine(967)-C(5))-methyltransferase RsmB [Fastidiosibacter lacustris]
MLALNNPRAIACHIIHQIVQHKESLIHLDQLLKAYNLDRQNTRLVYVLCYGVFRHFFYLDACVDRLAKSKTKAKIRLISMVGLYQLLFMNKAKHALIHETVEACQELNLENAKGFINALLRKVALDSTVLPPMIGFPEIPDWLYGKLKKHYPYDIKCLIDESNKQAPMFLRLNQQKNQTELLTTLKQQGIEYHITDLPYCIYLQQACNIDELPLFDEGFYTVQDLSAQYAAHILQPKPNEKVLDACAAPGGKSTHLLEYCPDIQLTIMDNNQKRFPRIKENIKRLQQLKLNITFLLHNATQALPQNSQFDKILIDAPCSATGVIRRHPDIKVLRTPEEVKSIVETQKAILNNLWQYLKPNGLMLYATCSILPEENDKQINSFLQNHLDAYILDIPILNFKAKQQHGYQLFPKTRAGDGFYYCLIQKK